MFHLTAPFYMKCSKLLQHLEPSVALMSLSLRPCPASTLQHQRQFRLAIGDQTADARSST